MHTSQSKYYQNLAEQLDAEVKKLLVEIALLERDNTLGKNTQKGIGQRSYRLPDGTYVDDQGNPIDTPSQPEDQTSPDYVGPRSSLANPPAQPQPSVQDQINQQFDQAAQAEKDGYEGARKKYYNRRNQEEKDKAEETLARIAALDMSKMSSSGRAQVAVNKLKAERALKRDRFDKESIDRMAASDRAEKFMTPEQKAAREARNKAAVAGMEKSAHEKMGHTQNAQGEWVDAQGRPASLAGTVDRFGPNVKIQGTNMTYGEFEKQTGRKYNAFSKEDSALVNKLAGAGRYSSEAARQGALTSDATNQAYRQQNDDLARRQGELDRKADASQRELDRFRNDPQYRDQLRKAEMDKVRPGLEAEQRARDEESARIKAQGDANFAQGVQNQIQQQFNQAGIQARNREAGPGKVGVPSLLAKPGQEPKAPNLISRPEGAAPEAPTLLQAPPPETPAAPVYTGPGSKDYGKPPAGIARPEDTTPDLLRRNSTEGIPVGSQIINRAESMAAKPGPTATPATATSQNVTTSSSPVTPPPPASTGGQVAQKAAQMAAPATSSGGMNQPMDLSQIPDEEEKPAPAGVESSTTGTQFKGVPPDQTDAAKQNAVARTTGSPVSQPSMSPATAPKPTNATPTTPVASATTPPAKPVAMGSQVTAAATKMAAPPLISNAPEEEDEQQKGPLPAGQNALNVPIPEKKRPSGVPVGSTVRSGMAGIRRV